MACALARRAGRARYPERPLTLRELANGFIVGGAMTKQASAISRAGEGFIVAIALALAIVAVRKLFGV